MGGVHGILTAGHVLREIERDGHFVMLSATGRSERTRSLKVVIEDGAMLINWSGRVSREGPDIGFIRLPNEIRDMALQNLAFYNYAVRYKLYEDGRRPASTQRFYVLGALDDGSEISLRENGFSDVKTNFGYFTGELVVDDPDLREAGSLIFLPGASPSNPESYKGLSGSGVWAVNSVDGPMGHILIGVIYFQYEEITRGVRPLVFHSVEWVYNWLYDQVSRKYPSEFSDFSREDVP